MNWHPGVSATWRDRPTTPRKGERQICRWSRPCRFVARTNELFQKGEAPRTTAVATLSRPQKREQATKSRPTKSRPPNPARESSAAGAENSSAHLRSTAGRPKFRALRTLAEASSLYCYSILGRAERLERIARERGCGEQHLERSSTSFCRSSAHCTSAAARPSAEAPPPPRGPK